MTVPIDKLVDKNRGLYTLVLAVAKRAIEVSGGSQPLVKCPSKKASTIALEEFKENKVSFMNVEGTEN